MHFSIIIPTRNRPSQLKQCLEAIARLEYPKELFEVIIVDDGSDVAVEAVSAEFPLTVLRQPHSGPAVARNFGAQKARGIYLAFTDDDCLPDPLWLSELEKFFAQNPDCLAGGRTINILTENLCSVTSQLIMEQVYRTYNSVSEESTFFASNNIAVQRELFNNINGFNEKWPLAAAEDREFCDRWLFSGRRMSYAENAIIRHAHDLTLAGFLKQHFNYGRGAFIYHQCRAERKSGEFKPDFHFYFTSFLNPVADAPVGQRIPLLMLLMLWHLANAAGFFYEGLRRKFMR